MRLALLVMVAAGCADFATPAELATPQIIAVVADPPVVRPGSTTRVTAVVAGPGGVQAGLVPRWSLVEAFPTVAPMGMLTVDGDGVIYTAPAVVPPRPEGVPPVDSLAIEIDVVDDGAPRTLSAIKAIGVLDVDSANPTFELTVGDATALEVRGPRAGMTLALTPSPAAGEDARFAWYATAGQIEDYQSNPTQLVADDAATGTLIAVYRDGTGGVAWRAYPLAIE